MKKVSINNKHKLVLGFIVAALIFGGGYFLGQGGFYSAPAEIQTPTEGEVTDESEETLINLNTADYYELQEIPGIGPKTAEDIVKFRDENGGFNELQDLVILGLISQTLADEIADFVEVSFQ